jgi:hypothetical protein
MQDFSFHGQFLGVFKVRFSYLGHQGLTQTCLPSPICLQRLSVI